jgi:hypothetical protein
MRARNSPLLRTDRSGTVTVRRRFIVAVLGGVSAASLLFGFVAGWAGSRRLGTSLFFHPNRSYLADKGDAPQNVRGEVVRALRTFQAGYNLRDPSQLKKFMRRLFPDSENILILGTDPGEWIRGRESAERFVGKDWADWGNLRLAVDDAGISALGDVAWLVTTGTVADRPLRFLAVLTRTGGRWQFRQVQFQWEGSSARLSDLLRPSVIGKLRLQ